jgi:hypothetical protein
MNGDGVLCLSLIAVAVFYLIIAIIFSYTRKKDQ